ncbi:hypothetical protein AB0O87_15475 [Microbacterium sp. NPDC076768]|uniref:hypothetical protein n=1 Tax=Microbacterium sp. NPDC076768 TaxID=3154858 RepID=UPI0034168494
MNRHTPKNPDPALRYRRRQRNLRIGQAIMVIGALVVVIHWLTHLEAFGPGQPEGWIDLVAGYPMGLLLVIIGAIVSSRKPK